MPRPTTKKTRKTLRKTSKLLIRKKNKYHTSSRKHFMHVKEKPDSSKSSQSSISRISDKTSHVSKHSRMTEGNLTLAIIPIDEKTFNRMTICNIELSEMNNKNCRKNTVCTETSLATLGFMMHSTFKTELIQNKGPRDLDEIQHFMQQSLGGNILSVRLNYTDIFNELRSNTGILSLTYRNNEAGHTVILAKNSNNVNILIDPMFGSIYSGNDEINNYLKKENLLAEAAVFAYVNTPPEKIKVL
jgi:hypothetical protein